MAQQRHSSAALPAQHDASLASPTEPASLCLHALVIDLSQSGAERPLMLFPPELHGARITDPLLIPHGTSSCQPCPSPTSPSQMSWEPHCSWPGLSRGFPRRAGELGVLSEGSAAAAPGGNSPAGLGDDSPPSRARLRVQSRDVFPGQSTGQAGATEARPSPAMRSPQQGDAAATAERAGKALRHRVLLWRGDADSGRASSWTAPLSPLSSAGGSVASAHWPTGC